MGWIAAALIVVVGGSSLYWARRRIRGRVPLREAARGCSVAELTLGRFRIVGRVVPLAVTNSAIDASPCVFVERARYRTVGSELVPVLREVTREVVAHPFDVDDGTGRVRVDPASAHLDAITVYEDEGLLAERRLRAGEEIEVVASWEPFESEHDGGPYRAVARSWRAVADPYSPPRIAYRFDPTVSISHGDDLASLLNGVGVILIVLGLFVGTLAAL